MRRRPANGISSAAQNYETAFVAGVLDLVTEFRSGRQRFLVGHKFDPEHHSQTTHVADHVVFFFQLVKTEFQIRTDLTRIVYKAAFEQLDRFERRSEGNGIPAERRGVRALVPVHDVSLCGADADRHARTDAFCHADDVGLNAFVMVEREHLAGAAHAGLHFVDAQHNAVLVTAAADLFYAWFRSGK